MAPIIRLNTVVVDEYQIHLSHVLRQLQHTLMHGKSIGLFASYSSAYGVNLERFIYDLEDYVTAIRRFLELAEQVEHELTGLNTHVNSAVFWMMGRMMPALIAASGPAIIAGVTSLFIVSAARGRKPEEVLTDLVVAAHTSGVVPVITKQVVQGADDLAAGMLGLPKPPSHNGVVKTSQGLIALANVTNSSYLQETQVQVTREHSRAVRPPKGFEDVLERIPRAEKDGGQVRIDYFQDTETHVVYIGGTLSPEIESTQEPWDMTSNIQSIAEQESGSYRATIEAMRQAGIDAQDNVIMVGHSQGGLIATQVAVSQEFAVTDVIAVGAPVSHIEVPENTSVLEIKHTEDFIPSLSGIPTATSSSHHVVSRTLYSPQNPAPREPLMPAHSLKSYVETAKLMDHSSDATVRSRWARISKATQGEGESTVWKAVRK